MAWNKVQLRAFYNIPGHSEYGTSSSLNWRLALQLWLLTLDISWPSHLTWVGKANFHTSFARKPSPRSKNSILNYPLDNQLLSLLEPFSGTYCSEICLEYRVCDTQHQSSSLCFMPLVNQLILPSPYLHWTGKQVNPDKIKHKPPLSSTVMINISSDRACSLRFE